MSGVRTLTPRQSPPWVERGVEDVRVFCRADGLHGVGVGFPEGRITQCELLLDYAEGSYRVIRDYGQPFGHTEKNWSPPSVPTPLFDFVYSPTQVVHHGRVKGQPYNGRLHGGTQLLPYKDGWISVAHQALPLRPFADLWYMSVAIRYNKYGLATHQSQFFDFGSGWRAGFRESVEFVSGGIWLVPDTTLLLSLGVQDSGCALVRVPVSAFRWVAIGGWYKDYELAPGLRATVV